MSSGSEMNRKSFLDLLPKELIFETTKYLKASEISEVKKYKSYAAKLNACKKALSDDEWGEVHDRIKQVLLDLKTCNLTIMSLHQGFRNQRAISKSDQATIIDYATVVQELLDYLKEHLARIGHLKGFDPDMIDAIDDFEKERQKWETNFEKTLKLVKADLKNLIILK